MSFTADVKKELVARGIKGGKSPKAKRAAFSAFIRTSGTLGFSDGAPAFFLVSETETVAEFFMETFAEIFQAELLITRAAKDKKNGRDKLIMQCPAFLTAAALKKLGITKSQGGFRDGILPSLVNEEESAIAYIKGAFLGGGSCILPSGNGAGYHLEFVFSEKKTAWDFCKLLQDFELIAKLVERKDTFVAYIKSKEMISDFLSVIGAENSLKKFADFVEKRDEANRDNRAKNCMAGNADKSAIAAVKQVVALKKLEETKFKDLSEELASVARARLKNPTMSLKELAKLTGVSKSCLNHRIRKLMEIAGEL
jgi:DNA-binding protein WhiA